MNEQGAVLFFDEDDLVRELVTTDADEPYKSWKADADALRDLAADGWQIEGPFSMCPKVAGLPKVWFLGYGLTRLIHYRAHAARLCQRLRFRDEWPAPVFRNQCR